MRSVLPVADRAAVLSRGAELARSYRRPLLIGAVLQLLAAAAALVPPRLLGHLVGGIDHGLTRADIDRTTLALAAAVLGTSVLTRWARFRAFVVGEQMLAELREDFVESVLSLPLGTVESAGTGDLLTRTTSDVDSLSRTVRFAVPEVLVALITFAATLVAMVLTSPLMAAASAVAVPSLLVVSRWYLKRAPDAYLAERAAGSAYNSRVAESVEAGRTTQSLRLEDDRIALAEQDMAAAYRSERRTLRLRCVFFPGCELSYVLPVVGTLVLGGLLVQHHRATLAEVTAVTLYAQQLTNPIDMLLSWLDELQIGLASFARLLGVRDVPDDRVEAGVEPTGQDLRTDDLHFSYVAGREVLAGIDLALRPGERLAIVGPSGAGKSTLGRLLAGVHPPTRGSVSVGGAELVGLPVERLRKEVSLVTQEHHVFAGTLADNLRLALPQATVEQLVGALNAVDWTAIPLDTVLGAGGLQLSPAQAQQIALARLVLADPHTLVLDEATALLDPRAARHLERSLSAVLEGRTVVAIAHRLHTASDADRVAVVDGGRVIELGTHDELVAADGSYASLWRSWHGD